MNLPFKTLNTFQKYCDNQLTYEEFLSGINEIDTAYAMDKWKSFQNNPVGFITSENRYEFFKEILNTIEKTGYKA